MKYWIRINNAERGPYSESEIRQIFGASLPSNTPCAKVGETSWSTLQNLLPEIGTAEPLPEPPKPDPSPHADAIANGVIKKIIALPIFIVTGIISAPFFIKYDKTNDPAWGISFFAVIVLGMSASIIVPMHIIAKHESDSPRPIVHSIPLIRLLFRKQPYRKAGRNPFIQK